MPEPASGGDRQPDHTRIACRPGHRWRGLARAGRQTERARQHQSAAVAAIFTRVESDREHLTVPAAELPEQPRVRQLPRDRRRMLRRAGQAYCHTGQNPSYRQPRLCQKDQFMSRLV